MDDQHLLETWQIHARVNLYVLNAVPAAALTGSAPNGRGRTAGEMFAHVHNVRLMWLEAWPELARGLAKVEKESAGDKAALKKALQASAAGIEGLIAQALAAGGKVKGFKLHASAFTGYLIAHESYHHGEIGVLLGQAGQPLDKKTAYGMWEWG